MFNNYYKLLINHLVAIHYGPSFARTGSQKISTQKARDLYSQFHWLMEASEGSLVLKLSQSFSHFAMNIYVSF